MYKIHSRIKRPAPGLFSIFKLTLFFLLFSCFKAGAQGFSGDDDRTYGLGLRAEYDMPMGNLKFTYKGAPSGGLSFYINQGAGTAEIGLGYREYKPKQDTFYYLVNNNDYGTATFSKFKTTMFYLGAAYNLSLSDAIKLYGGFNLGLYITKFSSTSTDAFVNAQDIVNENEAYIAPKIGLNLALTDNIHVKVQGAYNLFSPIGKAQYNSRVGTFYYSITTGATLVYNF